VAATGSVAAVFVAFGVWAAVSGAAQLVVALRRRAQLGNEWPLLLANGVSVIGGVAFIIAAAVGHPNRGMLAICGHWRHGVRHPGLAARAAPSPPGERRARPERKLMLLAAGLLEERAVRRPLLGPAHVRVCGFPGSGTVPYGSLIAGSHTVLVDLDVTPFRQTSRLTRCYVTSQVGVR